jgi:predicted metal-dependent peptidase
MLEAPYFGEIAASLRMAATPEIPTFLATGEVLRFNPDWLDSLESEELEAVLANAAMHRVLGHEERRERRLGRLWQLATDYAVNALLVRNGFRLPEGMLYDVRFSGMYAEEIYAELRAQLPEDEEREEEREEDREPSESAPERSERRSPESLSRGRREERQSRSEGEEALERARLEEIFARHERGESLPEGLERLVPRYFSRCIDWRELLRRHFNELLKTSYRFTPPNSKHLYRGIALPSLHSETLEIVVAIDSSGSVDAELLGAFTAELESILEQFDDYRIELLVADSRVRSHRTLTPGERLEERLEGGGGTDFRPVFDYVERRLEPPRLLLYFTDGAGSFPADAPLYDVLWVLSREGEVPFGEKIVLER